MTLTTETYKIKQALKSILKDKKISYEDLGLGLNISLATVKRLLNQGELSLAKLGEICDFLEISFYEVIELSKNKGSPAYVFLLQQEKFLAKSITHFLVFRSLVEKKGYFKIKTELKLDDRELSSILIKMDALELIKFQSDLKIHLIAKFPYQLISNGPIETMAKKRIQELLREKCETTALNLDASKEQLRAFELPLSEKASDEFRQEILDLLKKYKTLSEYQQKMNAVAEEQFSGIMLFGNFSLWK